MASSAVGERGLAKLYAWRRDPALFCREVLGFEPWHADGLGCDTQRDIMRSVAQNRRVAIRSGHKCGKSRLCAAIALHEFVCYPGSRTVITAPTHRQIEEVIWFEIRQLHRAAKIPIGGLLAITPGKGLRNLRHDTQVFGFSTNEAEKFSGISGSRVTYILDEASGVDPVIYNAIAGNRMGGARLVLISNPTQPTGEFHDAFHGKARLYVRHHISSVLLARAVEEGRIPRHKGLADAEAVAEFATEWGRDSDEYRVRADGDFALQGAHAIIAAGDYDAAINRWAPMTFEWSRHRFEVAVDVARFGDDESAIVGRRGRHVLLPEGHRQLDGPALAMKVVNFVQRNKSAVDGVGRDMKPRIRVETVGIGASCFDTLRLHFKHMYEIVPFEPSSQAADPDKYVNLRAEAWFNARRLLQTGPWELPQHQRMRTEALTPHYIYDKKNRYQVELKENIKQRLNGQSPDYGDALVICLWEPPGGYDRIIRIPGV